MGTEDEEQLTLQNRCLAAAGAAIAAATVVNPLDVVKTRIQAQAMASAGGRGTAIAVNDPQPLVHTLYERWGICETPTCVRRTPKGLACGSASESAASAAARRGAGGAGAGVLDESIWHAMRAIARTEGISAMWRGTTASLLVSVPMVGIYMPLYDNLLRAWEPEIGAAAPVVAGSAARTLACCTVAPFELLRTRLQAAPARPGDGRGSSLRLLAPGGEPAGSFVGALRRVPQLWTGLSATLLRDVPFSALYWAMVEPLRSAMLPRREHLHLDLLHLAPPAPRASTAGVAAAAAARAAAGAADAPVAPDDAWAALEAAQAGGSGGGGGACNSALSQQQSQRSATAAAAGAGLAAAAQAASEPHFHHTRGEILLANLVSGFVAGGLAAAATTPFDVVKTRMQVVGSAVAPAPLPAPALACEVCAAGPSGGAAAAHAPPAFGAEEAGRRGIIGEMRAMYAAEGLPGLFTGVRPRAYRAAPACAIVITCYELLKSVLTPE